uniref:Uncharacterized protein n=1 Tax=viral metagenome TaxID=1070528 RepID=A0A6H1ZHY3_9ZZZZ
MALIDWLRSATDRWAEQQPPNAIPVAIPLPALAGMYRDPKQFQQQVMSDYGLTPEQNEILRRTQFESSVGGGSYWSPPLAPSAQPGAGIIRVAGQSPEAAIHEMAHAYWHWARQDPRVSEEFARNVKRLADEPFGGAYPRAQMLANKYVYGEQEGSWPGLVGAESSWEQEGLPSINDWEMYAGLASGTMGDISQLPPYLRSFYEPLFTGQLRVPPDYTGRGTPVPNVPYSAKTEQTLFEDMPEYWLKEDPRGYRDFLQRIVSNEVPYSEISDRYTAEEWYPIIDQAAGWLRDIELGEEQAQGRIPPHMIAGATGGWVPGPVPVQLPTEHPTPAPEFNNWWENPTPWWDSSGAL